MLVSFRGGRSVHRGAAAVLVVAYLLFVASAPGGAEHGGQSMISTASGSFDYLSVFQRKLMQDEIPPVLFAAGSCPIELSDCVVPSTDFSTPLTDWELRSGRSFAPSAIDSNGVSASCCLCEVASKCFAANGEFLGDLYSPNQGESKLYYDWRHRGESSQVQLCWRI
eukprot:scaffold475644_cov34-Prasinocladus_malaysianus.AAC.2